MKQLTIIGLLLLSQPGDLRKEVRVEDKLMLSNTEATVVIDNFWGGIEVKKGTSGTLSYKVLKTYSAKTQADLDLGAKEVELKVLRRNDSIIFYVSAPFICSKWEGCYDNCNSWGKIPYDFKFDYLVELPSAFNLEASTIGNGDVYVAGIEGKLKARNINGQVDIKEGLYVTEASSVNGDVNVNYKDRPVLDCKFNTVNGAINIYAATNLNVIVTGKTMFGELFTAFDYVQRKPELIRTTSRDGAATVYKLEETFGIEIGKNGPTLSFETINGDIYLRKL